MLLTQTSPLSNSVATTTEIPLSSFYVLNICPPNYLSVCVILAVYLICILLVYVVCTKRQIGRLLHSSVEDGWKYGLEHLGTTEATVEIRLPTQAPSVTSSVYFVAGNTTAD